jgi:hypothetical protein
VIYSKVTCDSRSLTYRCSSKWLGAPRGVRGLNTTFCHTWFHFLAHGLGKIPDAGTKILKFIWTFIFVASLCMFIAQTSELLKDYLTYPVTMSIKMINKRDSLFPAITICNQNRLKRSKIQNSTFSALYDVDQEIENVLKKISKKSRR